MIRHRDLRRLIWVYTVCLGLSVRTLRVNEVRFLKTFFLKTWPRTWYVFRVHFLAYLVSTTWNVIRMFCLFVCVEVLRPSQPNGIMSSAVSLPNHTFTGQAYPDVLYIIFSILRVPIFALLVFFSVAFSDGPWGTSYNDDLQLPFHRFEGIHISTLFLTLARLNKLRCHAHFKFSANQIIWSWLLI